MRPSTIIGKLQELADRTEAQGDHVTALVYREAASIIARSVQHTLEKLEDSRAELRRIESEYARGQE